MSTAVITLPKFVDCSPNLGCDPEFFFKYKGEVVGAEKFIPKNGLIKSGDEGPQSSKFIIDGVQAELNPRPSNCRALLGADIAACFKTLQQELKKRGNGFSVDFSRTVKISKENLKELDEKSQKFGCAPSKSIYKKIFGLKINKVDPTVYRTRAAGGHIHIGKGWSAGVERALCKDYIRTVEMLDLLCGNTCVLLDRDKGNIERRKVYGKAGEFRQPPHGLEYRTLSNFWLTSYPLMSFAFGMVRMAVNLMADKNHELYYKEFTSKVSSKKVHDAINYNDFDLAMENFIAIEKLICEVTMKDSSRYPIHEGNLKEFHYFVKMIKSKGLEYWFSEDPLKHWANIKYADAGFHDFSLRDVRTDMIKHLKKAA